MQDNSQILKQNVHFHRCISILEQV